MTSRVEEYLKAMINDTGTDGLPTPKSRVCKLLYILAGKLGVIQRNVADIDSKIADVVDDKVAAAVSDIDMSGYAKTTDIPDSYTKTESDERYLTEIPDTVALKTDIPAVPDSYTKTESDERYLTEIPDTVALKTDVDSAIATAISGAMEASY